MRSRAMAQDASRLATLAALASFPILFGCALDREAPFNDSHSARVDGGPREGGTMADGGDPNSGGDAGTVTTKDDGSVGEARDGGAVDGGVAYGDAPSRGACPGLPRQGRGLTMPVRIRTMKI